MKERGRHTWLLIMCVSAVFALSACGKAPETAVTATPVPERTVDPALNSETRALEERLIAAAGDALSLETRALQENSDISSVRVPDQLLNQFLDALADENAWQHAQGRYTLTTSSGGDYVYEKPYSELITGSATDVYTIEDDTGWVEEIVDNTRYDPFTWVMSGEGGGQFAYMSVYGLNDDASGGELETVSRLDNSISGWSYDAFLAENGRYRFVELQLSPNEDGAIEAPYQWVLCVGDIGRSDARIEEFLLTGDELRLPREGLGLDLSADALSMEAARRGQRLSLLTLTDERLSYTEYRK